MANVNGFRGFRYNPEKIEDLKEVFAPPYDVISSREQEELYGLSPYNVVRLILPNCGGEQKYIKAGERLRDWISGEILIQDAEPSVYPYEQEFDLDGKKITRRGFIAAVRIEDFSSKIILPHERTFPKPKMDRLKLTLACKANLSPVFSIYSDPGGSVQKAIDKYMGDDPLADFVYRDGVRNRIWKISDRDLLSMIRTTMSDYNLLIADGHHRYETALEYRNIQRNLSNGGSGSEPYEYVMMYLCCAEDGGLVINPTHRVIKNIGYSDTGRFFGELGRRFSIEEKPIDEAVGALKYNEFAVVCNDSKNIFVIAPKHEGNSRHLDLGVRNLHGAVFGAMIDEEKSEILYTKSLEEVVNLVRGGEYKLGFILPPLSALDILQVVLADEKLPHKTTYFYPKILSGLVLNPLW